MDEDFDTDLDSPIADILQCTPDSKGDHILAARFLNRFVPAEIPWIHIDLAASNRSGGLAISRPTSPDSACATPRTCCWITTCCAAQARPGRQTGKLTAGKLCQPANGNRSDET